MTLLTEEDDFAHRLTARLDSGVTQMDASTLRHLASIRRQAISASHTRLSPGHGVLALLHRHGFASALLAVAILFSGWWFLHNAKPAYSPETDILLLTGDLPPNAYADKTVSQWLEQRAAF